MKTIRQYILEHHVKSSSLFAQILGSFAGKKIAPPETEKHLYDKSFYETTSANVSGSRIVFRLASPIHKRASLAEPFEVVCATKFFSSDDTDSIWYKFTMVEAETLSQVSQLSPAEVAAVNSVRSRRGVNTCCVCGRELTPIFGMLFGCKKCET